MKTIKALFLFIATILSLLLYVALFSSIYEYLYQTSPNLLKGCSHSSINDFDVKECHYRISKEPIKLISYDFNRERIITLMGADSLDDEQREFLKESLKETIGDTKEIKKIKVVAHTNFFYIDSFKALQKRASKIKKIVQEIGYKRNILSSTHSKAPFLEDINMNVNGTLLTVLDLNSDLKELKAELNISKNYNLSELQKRFKKSNILDNYKERLEPYRSTVLLISFKK